MKLVYALLVVGLTGCQPYIRKFPEAPPVLLEAEPASLALTPTTDKLSDILPIITDNYATYYSCRAKVEGWQTWYTKQKSVFEAVK